jgi:hypothetical protein
MFTFRTKIYLLHLFSLRFKHFSIWHVGLNMQGTYAKGRRGSQGGPRFEFSGDYENELMSVARVDISSQKK